MEWFLSVAALPFVVCGLMCLVPAAVAAVAVRRRSVERSPEESARVERDPADR